MSTTATAIALIAAGAFTMIGAASNWGIVARSGKLLNRIFGDTIARAIYFVGGGVVFFAGVGQLIDIHWF
jgi:hypothetical protein